jgi:hypothetical protein
MPLQHYGNQSFTALLIRTFGNTNRIVSTGVWSSAIFSMVMIFFSFKKDIRNRIAILAVVSLIASPIVWKHTMSVLVIPNIYIANCLEKHTMRFFSIPQKILLFIYVILAVFTSTGFVGKNISVMLMQNSVLLLMQLVLLGYLFAVRKY